MCCYGISGFIKPSLHYSSPPSVFLHKSITSAAYPVMYCILTLWLWESSAVPAVCLTFLSLPAVSHWSFQGKAPPGKSRGPSAPAAAAPLASRTSRRSKRGGERRELMSREWVVLQQTDTRTLKWEDHQEKHRYRRKLVCWQFWWELFVGPFIHLFIYEALAD